MDLVLLAYYVMMNRGLRGGIERERQEECVKEGGSEKEKRFIFVAN